VKELRFEQTNSIELSLSQGSSLRGAVATKQSSFPRKPPWIASLTLAMTRHLSRPA
jgi:hypothetical protein